MLGKLIGFVAVALAVVLSACGGGAQAPAAGPGGGQPAAPATAAAPAAQSAGGVSQELLDAARKEGSVVWYTSVETSVAEEVARKFEAAHSGIKVEVNRTGSERVMQRVMQEAQANVKAVDVIHTSTRATSST